MVHIPFPDPNSKTELQCNMTFTMYKITVIMKLDATILFQNVWHGKFHLNMSGFFKRFIFDSGILSFNPMKHVSHHLNLHMPQTHHMSMGQYMWYYGCIWCISFHSVNLVMSSSQGKLKQLPWHSQLFKKNTTLENFIMNLGIIKLWSYWIWCSIATYRHDDTSLTGTNEVLCVEIWKNRSMRLRVIPRTFINCQQSLKINS